MDNYKHDIPTKKDSSGLDEKTKRIWKSIGVDLDTNKDDQVIYLPPRQSLIRHEPDYHLNYERHLVIPSSNWQSTEGFPFVKNNNRWYYPNPGSNPWTNSQSQPLYLFKIADVFQIVKDTVKIDGYFWLVHYIYGEQFQKQSAIISYSDFKNRKVSKAFPWIDPKLEEPMNLLIYDLIRTSSYWQFIIPKRSGWSIAHNGVLFHAKGFDYIEDLHEYYPEDCTNRIYLEDQFHILYKNCFNKSGLPWQVTVANLLRLSSLLLSFFKKESVELKQLFLITCNTKDTADKCSLLLKNDRFDSKTVHSLREKNIEKILNATNDGVVLFRHEKSLDRKKSRIQGWDDLQRDINHTNGMHDYSNHLICVVADDSAVIEQDNIVCKLSFDDVTVDIAEPDIQCSAFCCDRQFIKFVKEHWQGVISAVKDDVQNPKVPESIPTHQKNTYLIVKSIYILIHNNLPDMLPSDFDESVIEKWLSGEFDVCTSDEFIIDDFRSVLTALLNRNQLKVIEERRDVDNKLNVIAVTNSEMFFDKLTLDKSIISLMSNDIDRNRLLSALMQTGYLHSTDKNEYIFRIHRGNSDGKEINLYCIRRSVLGNANTDKLFHRQNEGKDQFFLTKDEMPDSLFLPLIKYQSHYAGIKLSPNGTDNRHLLISGTSSSGKTYSLCHIAAYYASIGHKVVIFDTSGLLTKSDLEDYFSCDYVNKAIAYYSIKSKGEIPVNILKQYDTESSIVEQMYGVLECALPNLPEAKFGQLKNDLVEFFTEDYKAENNTISLDVFGKLKQYISKLKSRAKLQENLIPLLNEIMEYAISESTWSDIFSIRNRITVISNTKSSGKMPALIKMLLYSLYQYQKAESNKGDMIPLDIMIDELHDEDVKKDTIIQTIMNDGRHFRIGLAAGTHSYKKEKYLREIMGNTNIRIFLKPDGNGIDALAKWLNDPSIDRDLLYRMQAGRDCIVDTALYNKESKDHEHIVLFGEFCSWFNLQKSNNDDEPLSDK